MEKDLDELLEILKSGDISKFMEIAPRLTSCLEELKILRYESQEWNARYEKKLDEFAKDGVKQLSVKMGELIGLVSHKMQIESELPSMISLPMASEKTGLPEFYLKRICNEGLVKSVKNGSKFYINEQSLNDYLNLSK